MYVLVASLLLSAALRGSGLVARALLRADLFEKKYYKRQSVLGVLKSALRSIAKMQCAAGQRLKSAHSHRNIAKIRFAAAALRGRATNVHEVTDVTDVHRRQQTVRTRTSNILCATQLSWPRASMASIAAFAAAAAARDGRRAGREVLALT